MTVVSDIRNEILALESQKNKLQNSINQLRLIAESIEESLSRPPVKGRTFKDYAIYSNGYLHAGEVSNFAAWAYYSAHLEKWSAVVEWEVNGARSANKPISLGWHDNFESALLAAERAAENESAESRGKIYAPQIESKVL